MKLHQLEGYIQSIYLIEYPHGLMLLDGCCRADIDTVRDYITETLKRPFTDLHTVVVTHMHPDHAGAAHRFRALTGCRIVSANKDTHWYRGLNGILMHLTDLVLANWVAGRLGKQRRNLWYSRHLHPDIKVDDGDTVPGFEEWQLLEMPGHTDRDLAVLHTPSQRMYVADLVVKVKRRFIPPFPVFHPNQYRASINRLISLAPASLLLAHGGEVTLTEEDYQHLTDNLPVLPKTHWRATKARMRQLLKRIAR